MTAVVGILLGAALFALFGAMRAGERRSGGCCMGGAMDDRGCAGCPTAATSGRISLEPELKDDRSD